ncbi:sigma-54-dependent Fis family transcriptional regulator [Streptomyces sp. UNOC14_S4]|uniref:sigma-54-dependent Fis family transcriptional regulator n=1 Tax=Streptomyces sp. UNOC14_S4 TaxID=2872340 RepID=UPI001E48CF13|nr:helix-turn-helix domain-containing protein [Streptomyces sp. UNOC14_S4]MCC3768835.1 GAF domain-containing protein [Streptomyces sp. UNOC14_S4]
MEAARPSFDTLCRFLGEADISVVMADACARIQGRRDLSSSAGNLLDEISLVPGCSCAEKTVGTNAVGTVLETGHACCVSGAEHVAELFHPLACAGAPIHDQVTGALEGVLALACRTEDFHPLMLALARQTADGISHRLQELAHRVESEAFQEFLGMPSRKRQPLVLLTDDLVVANKAAVRLFGDQRYWQLRQLTVHPCTSAGSPGGQVREIELPSHRLVQARSSLLQKHGEIQGYLIEFLSQQHSSRKQPRTEPFAPLPGLAGESEHWLETGARLVAARRSATWTLVMGEPGVGKRTLIRAAHRYAAGQSRFCVADAREASRSPRTWLAAVAKEIRGGTATMVLSHLQVADPPLAADISDLLTSLRANGQAGNIWVVGLITLPVLSEWRNAMAALPPAGGERKTVEHFTLSFHQTLEVLPLRYRRQDVRALVPALLTHRTGHPALTCRPDTMKALVNASWPGNVVQLERCLRAAADHCHGNLLLPHHLPEDLGNDRGRVLSPWETAEHDAIVRALKTSHGDRAAAARFLGISRATIYRKIRGYGIDAPLPTQLEKSTDGTLDRPAERTP